MQTLNQQRLQFCSSHTLKCVTCQNNANSESAATAILFKPHFEVRDLPNKQTKLQISKAPCKPIIIVIITPATSQCASNRAATQPA
jgi:hypothetical protein